MIFASGELPPPPVPFCSTMPQNQEFVNTIRRGAVMENVSNFTIACDEIPFLDSNDFRQQAEFALLLDAIPTEFREEIILAVLHLQSDQTFQESYLVNLSRQQLSDCLLEKTGSLPDLASLKSLDPLSVKRQLHPLIEAKDPAQVAIALSRFLDFLANVL
jgi:hypothetical protein